MGHITSNGKTSHKLIINGKQVRKITHNGKTATLMKSKFNTSFGAAGIDMRLEYISDGKLRCHLYLFIKDEYGNSVTIDHGTREISEGGLSYNTGKTRSFSGDLPDVTINGRDYIGFHRGQRATNITLDLQFHGQRSGYIGVGERRLHIGNQSYFNGDDDTSFHHDLGHALLEHPNNMSGMWRGYFDNIDDTWFERK